MSNEISITVSGLLNNAPSDQAPLKRTYSHGRALVDQSNKRRAGHSQALTSSWEAIDTEDVTEGYLFALNLDGTCNVELGTLESGSGGSTVKFAVVKPDDPPALVHFDSDVTLYARAAVGTSPTAVVDIEIWSV